VVSYSRIYIGVHYPLDIFGGALFGVIVGRLVLAMIKRQLAAVATLNAQP
jgi:undecaprenyl-diphosphatase